MSNGDDKLNPVQRKMRSQFAPPNNELLHRAMLQGFRARFPREGELKHVTPSTRVGPWDLPVTVLPTLLINEIYAGLTGRPAEAGLGAGTLKPGEIDVTDPAVDPGDTDLSPYESMVRQLRRFSRQFGAGSPGTFSGGEQAIQEGNLLPPKDWKEGASDIVATLLASIAPWVGGGVIAGEIVGASSSLAAAAGARGGLGTGLGTNIPRALGRALRFPTKMGQAAEQAGLRGGGPIKLLTGKGAPLNAAGVEEAVGAILGIDAPIGAAYGAGEAYLENQLGHDTDVGAYARNFAVFGMGLGMFFRAKTTLNSARTLGRIGTGVQEGLGHSRGVAPGVVVDGIVTEMKGGALRFREQKTGHYVAKDNITPEQLRKFQNSSVAKAEEIIEGARPMDDLETAVTTSASKATDWLPPDLQNPESLQDINLVGAKYYMDAAVHKVRKLGETKVNAELIETAKFLFQPEFAAHERRTAAGRIMALKRALGELQPQLPGQLSFEQEIEALTFVRQHVPRVGSPDALQQAARIGQSGRPEVARRMEELILRGQTGEGDLVTSYHPAVKAALNKIGTKMGRGFKKDGMGIFEGQPVRLTENPYLGLAYAETLGAKRELLLVNTAEVIPWPKAGKTVRLRDGSIVKANAVEVARGEFRTGERWIPFSEIAEVGSAKSVRRVHEATVAHEATSVKAKDVQPIPPTQAITSAGESVTVTGIGSEGAEVVNAAGVKQTIKRKDLKRSTKQKPPQPEPVAEALVARPVSSFRTLGLVEGPETIYERVDRMAANEAFATGSSTPATIREKVREADYLLAKLIENRLTPAEETLLGAQLDAITQARAAAPGSPRAAKEVEATLKAVRSRVQAHEVVDFAPGTVPDADHRILYAEVPAHEADEFIKAIESGTWKAEGPMTAHVLPPEPSEEAIVVALEFPAEAGGKWKRSKEATAAIKALGTPTKVNDYHSPVTIPAEAASQMRVYRIQEDLHRAVQRPSPMLEGLSPEETQQYLRNLLAMNDEVLSAVAAPAKKVRKGRAKIAKGVETSDASQVYAGESEVSEGIIEVIEAKEAAFRAEGDKMQRTIVAEAAVLDPRAAALAAFQRKGLTPETEEFWSQLLDDLAVSPEGFEREAKLGISALDPSERVFITKREQPGLRRTEKGGLEPYAETHYEVTPVDGESQTLREGIVKLKSTREVTDWMLAHGYEPSPLMLMNAEYIHSSKPSLVASIKIMRSAGLPDRPGVLAAESQTQASKAGKTKAVEAVRPEKESTQRLIALLADEHQNTGAGTPELALLSQAEFTSFPSAHAWMSERGFVLNPVAMQDVSRPARFRRLPSLDRLNQAPVKAGTLSPEAIQAEKAARDAVTTAQTEVNAALSDLRQAQKIREGLEDVGQIAKAEATIAEIIEDMKVAEAKLTAGHEAMNRARLPLTEDELYATEQNLKELLYDYQQVGPIPEAVGDYAANFAPIFYAKTERAPFDKVLRDAINSPVTEDIGPQAYSHVLDNLEKNALSIHTISPVDVSLLTGFRVGTTKESMERAIVKLRSVLTDELPRASKLNTIQTELLRELEEASVALDRAVLTTEFDAVNQRLRSIRKETIEAGRTATHEMRLGSETRVPPDLGPGGRVFYNNVLDGPTKESIQLQHARALKKLSDAQKTQTLYAESAAKSSDIVPSPGRFDPESMDLARYTPTGQVVQLVGGPLEKLVGPEVTVRFIATGEEQIIARELLDKGKSAGANIADATLSHWVAEGKFADVAPSRARFGYGPLETKLGLVGTNDRRAVELALQKKSEELAQTLKINKDGSLSVRSKKAVDELLTMYRDAQWLDQVVETKPSKIEVAGILQPKFVEGGDIRYTPSGHVSGSQVKMKKVQPTAEEMEKFLAGESVEGKPQATSEKDMYTRAGPVEGVEVTEYNRLSNVILGALRRQTGANSATFEKAFRRTAYDRMRQALGNHPFAELQARAFAGFLEPQQEAILRGWMKDIGMGQNTPLAKGAIELHKRQLLDPHSARFAVQLNREMTTEVRLGSLLGGIPQSKNKMVFKPIGNPDDIGLGQFLGIPWKIVQKHPITRLVMDMLYRARDGELREMSGISGWEQELYTLGVRKTDKEILRKVSFEARANNWVGWDEMAEKSATLKGMSPEKLTQLQTARRITDTFMEDKLDQHIRHLLRQRKLPVDFGPEDIEPAEKMARKALAAELHLDPSQIGEGAVVMHSHPDLVIRRKEWAANKAAPEAAGPKWTEDQIDIFMKLRRDYRSSVELPDQVPGLKADVYEEMKDVFDLLKRFGIDNYHPLIHEGNLALIVERGDKNVTMGWAGNWFDATDAARHLRKVGRVGPEEKMSIVENAQVVDDIILKHSNTTREHKALMDWYKTQVETSSDELSVLLERVKKPLPPTMRRPGDIHAMPRTAELEPVFADFDQEIGIYAARTARMNYRWKVRQAHETLHDLALDKALSESYNSPRLHGQDGMPELYNYMLDRLSLAVGERGAWERNADQLWMVLNMAQEAPKDFVRVLRGELNFFDVFNRKTYYQKYAARARASDILKIQSLIRLGLSPATAVANMTQRWVSTFPSLIDDTFGIDKAAKLMWESSTEGRQIWRAFRDNKKLTGDLGVLHEIIDDAGIELMVMKQLAGSGRSAGDMFGKPLHMGETPLKRGAEWFDYYAMYMFNGTEKVNRFSTSIAAVRKYAMAKGKGLQQLTSFERAEASEAARDLVRKTQFLYDELSMPKALSSMGPVGRILFQFKPFMLNMFSFQKDLLGNAIKGMAAGRPAGPEMQQLGAHLGALFALGGATGLLYSPFVSLPAEAFRLAGADFADPGTRVQAWLRKRRREMATPEENFANSQVFRADDVLFYGLPALTGLIPGASGVSLGERIGISGQDVLLSMDAPGFLGPHASVYLDLKAAWLKYLKTKDRTAGLVGGVGGALALSFVPRGIRRAMPYATSLSAIAGASLATKLTGGVPFLDFSPSREGWPHKQVGPFELGIPNPQSPFNGFLAESPEGRRWLSRVVPSAVRNSQRTFELLLGGSMLDLDGKPMHIPANAKWQEAFFAATGMPSIRKEEYQAASQYMLAHDEETSNTRQVYVDRIARALLRGSAADQQIVWDTYKIAEESDIEITQQMVDRELEALSQERIESVRARVSPQNR